MAKKKKSTSKKSSKKASKKKGADKQDAHFEFHGRRAPKNKVKTDKLSAARKALKTVFPDEDYEADYDFGQLRQSMPHLPSGIVALDHAIGGEPNRFGVLPCPGYPKGRITQIWGENHSGKTTVCLEAASAAISRGEQVCYIDWEYAIDPSYASYILGVPISDSDYIMWAQPDTLEAGMKIALTVAATGTDLIVMDSVGSAILEAHDEQSLKEIGSSGTGGAGYGAAARKWGRFLPKLKKLCRKQGSTVLLISQTRSTMSSTPWGPSTKPQGGKAFEFFADLRFELKKVKTIKENVYNRMTNKTDKRHVASKIRVRMRKCKIAASTGTEQEFYIRHGEGVDNLTTLIEVAKAHGMIKGSRWPSWTRANGEVYKANGFSKFREGLVDDEDLMDEFTAAVLPLLSSPAIVAPSDDDDGEELSIQDIVQDGD